jgi:integrase
MKIRKRVLRSGRIAWAVDLGMINGKRWVHQYPTKEAAEQVLAEKKQELRRGGMSAFELTDRDRVRYQEAEKKLAAVGASLEQAVDFYLLHAAAKKVEMTFDEMAFGCREQKYEEGMTPEYLRQLKSVSGSFSRAGYGARLAHEITTEEVTTWLKANQWANKTWNNYLTDLQTMFAWGKEQGALSINPCEEVSRKRTADGEIKFLSVDQCAALLRRAALAMPPLPRYDAQGRWLPVDPDHESFQDFLPFLVVGLFCGPRPDKELGGMPCEDIKLENRLIVIMAGRAKSRRRRTVDLPDNAVTWLEYARDHCGWTMAGKLQPANFKKRWKRLREQCGLFTGWPHDGIRHTFATYEYAYSQNEAKLQAMLGHRNAQTLHDHYRGLTTPQEAARFKGLMPPY